MDDRIVVGFSELAVKAAIDAALDKNGGFEADGPADTLAKAAGDGSAITSIDFPALARLGWPLLMQLIEQEGMPFPLKSPPSTAKVVRMLTPEIMVIKVDADGVLLDSRGTVPFGALYLQSGPAILLYGWSLPIH
jgi:hypothetical protein